MACPGHVTAMNFPIEKVGGVSRHCIWEERTSIGHASAYCLVIWCPVLWPRCMVVMGRNLVCLPCSISIRSSSCALRYDARFVSLTVLWNQLTSYISGTWDVWRIYGYLGVGGHGVEHRGGWRGG